MNTKTFLYSNIQLTSCSFMLVASPSPSPHDLVKTFLNQLPTTERTRYTNTRLKDNIDELFKFGENPDFLTYHLGKKNYSDTDTRCAILNAAREAPVCVTGVSGAGKTRTVLEILSTRWGIYFSASQYLQHGPQLKPCSTDLAWIASASASDGQADIFANSMTRIKCAVLARMLVLTTMKEHDKDFSCLDWVIMQLYPPQVKSEGPDIFEQLTKQLYFHCNSASIAQTIALVAESDADVCFVVDEAQLAMQQLAGQFSNGSQTAKHPFLFVVIRCLWEIGKTSGNCPILSGTGISVMQMSSVAVSAVAEPELARTESANYKMQVPISTVLDPTQIISCVKEMLSPQLLVPSKVELWSRVLVGRPRILWGFLALAVTTDEDCDAVFKKYRSWITGSDCRGTLYACIKSAMERNKTGETPFSPSIGSVVTEMVVNWLTGTMPAELAEKDKVDVMVDCGVCILEKNADGTKLLAKMREPLVVQAFLKYAAVTKPDLILSEIMGMLESATEASSQGFIFEILFFFAFQKALDKKSLRQLGLAPPNDNSGFLDEICDFPLESMGNSLLRLPDSANGAVGTVVLQSQFLDCHRKHLTFTTTQPRPRAGATPAKKDTNDLAVVGYTPNYVIVFITQVKFKLSTDYVDAVKTTYPELLLTQSKKRLKLTTPVNGRTCHFDNVVANDNKVEQQALLELLRSEKWGARTVCVVQLVVAFPSKVERLGSTRWIPRLPSGTCNSIALAQYIDMSPQPGSAKDLLVVVREDLLKAMLGDDVFKRLDKVKQLRSEWTVTNRNHVRYR